MPTAENIKKKIIIYVLFPSFLKTQTIICTRISMNFIRTVFEVHEVGNAAIILSHSENVKRTYMYWHAGVSVPNAAMFVFDYVGTRALLSLSPSIPSVGTLLSMVN